MLWINNCSISRIPKLRQIISTLLNDFIAMYPEISLLLVNIIFQGRQIICFASYQSSVYCILFGNYNRNGKQYHQSMMKIQSFEDNFEYFEGLQFCFAEVVAGAGAEEFLHFAASVVVRVADAEVAENDVGVPRDSDLLVPENEVNVVVLHSELPGNRGEGPLVAQRNKPSAPPFEALRADGAFRETRETVILRGFDDEDEGRPSVDEGVKVAIGPLFVAEKQLRSFDASPELPFDQIRQKLFVIILLVQHLPRKVLLKTRNVQIFIKIFLFYSIHISQSLLPFNIFFIIFLIILLLLCFYFNTYLIFSLFQLQLLIQSSLNFQFSRNSLLWIMIFLWLYTLQVVEFISISPRRRLRGIRYFFESHFPLMEEP